MSIVSNIILTIASADIISVTLSAYRCGHYLRYTCQPMSVGIISVTLDVCGRVTEILSPLPLDVCLCLWALSPLHVSAYHKIISVTRVSLPQDYLRYMCLPMPVDIISVTLDAYHCGQVPCL